MEVDDMSHQEVEDVVASLAGIENINNPSLHYSYIDFNTRVIGKSPSISPAGRLQCHLDMYDMISIYHLNNRE